MAACDLQIFLDRKDATYDPDETITGEVWVQVKEDNFDCARLFLEHRWHRRRSGKTTKGSKEVLVLATDVTWQAGLDYRFPFAIVAPTEPLTYTNEMFKINHYLRVKADPAHPTKPMHIQLSHAPKAEIQFISKIRDSPYKLLRVEPIEISLSELFGDALFYAFLSGIASVFLGFFSSISPTIIFVLVFLFLLGLNNRVYISTFLAELRLEKVNTYRRPKVDVNLEVTETGNILKCQLQIQPKGKAELGSSSLKLIVREEYEKTHYDKEGIVTVTEKDIIYEEKAFGHQSVPNGDGQVRRYELLLQLPGDLPTARGLEIIWQVNVKVILKKWFDWYRSYKLTIS